MMGIRMVAALLLAAVATANAQEPLDPPSRAARLSYVEGSVSLQPAGVDAWTAADLNRPLTSGDQLWSDRDSRAEIELGSAVVRVGEASSIAILNLNDEVAQVRVSSGSVSVNVRTLDQGGVEIDAPAAAVSLLQPGVYRVSVDDGGYTVVELRGGQAQIYGTGAAGNGQLITLQANQRGVFAPSGNFVTAVGSVGPPDSFDRWGAERDQLWAGASAAYVSDDVVGYQDLNRYGDWQQVPDYGYVWYPSNVDSDWAPYQVGEWVWVAPWGWTWIEGEPWGYAPFHYGRWAYIGRRWAWVPAPPRSRAVYAPALVAWVGSGANVGWFPLAPGEVYVPTARVSMRYVENVNVSNTRINVTQVNTVYNNPAQPQRFANRSAPGAVTVVSQSSFTSGQRVARNPSRAPAEQLRAMAPVARAPAIAPARQSLLGPGSLRVSQPPPNVVNRPVVFRRPPPAASFGRPLRPQALMRPDAGSAGVRSAQPAAARPQRPYTRPAQLTSPPEVRPQAEVRPAPRPESRPEAPSTPQPTPPIERRHIPERAPQVEPKPQPVQPQAELQRAPAPAPQPAPPKSEPKRPPPPRGLPSNQP
jgi:hypothetical protein